MSTLVLAIDTSTEIASVAVCRGDVVLAEDETPSEARHDHVLIARIDDVLRRAGVALRDVALLGVGLGPGAFGGLRVGLATMKGLSIATRIPVVGVSSLRALAMNAPAGSDVVLALADAHKGELYGALFRRSGAQIEQMIAPTHAAIPQLAAALPSERPVLLGHGLGRRRAELESAWPASHIIALDALPSARHIARDALHTWRHRGADDPARLLPIYIRDSDAKLPAEALMLAIEPKD